MDDSFDHNNLINRLDISYNEKLNIKITTEEEMSKYDMQMQALEALLTDMSMDATELGGDPLPVIHNIIDQLLPNS